MELLSASPTAHGSPTVAGEAAAPASCGLRTMPPLRVAALPRSAEAGTGIRPGGVLTPLTFLQPTLWVGMRTD